MQHPMRALIESAPGVLQALLPGLLKPIIISSITQSKHDFSSFAYINQKENLLPPNVTSYFVLLN